MGGWSSKAGTLYAALDRLAVVPPPASTRKLIVAYRRLPRAYPGGPRRDELRAPFCRHARPTAQAAADPPRHWEIELYSPGVFGGLAAATSAMPAVVAVQHVPL